MNASTEKPLLTITGLSAVTTASRSGAKLLHGVDLQVNAGEIVGLVGESGSGKSLTCRAISRVLPDGVEIDSGSIEFGARNLLELDEPAMERVRGREIAMILQNPMTSLNPVMRIGAQIAEPIMLHQGLDRAQARARALEALASVHIRDPEQAYEAFPHQLSGGMRQRVSGAIAMSCNPRLLIADEPTTALDPTIQKEYLALLQDLQVRTGVAVLIVTHDLGVVAAICDRVAVMYAGRIVEFGTTTEIFDHPAHPYTRALLGVLRSPATRQGRAATIPGSPPMGFASNEGCAFAPRCAVARPACGEGDPAEKQLSGSHRVRCLEAAAMAGGSC